MDRSISEREGLTALFQAAGAVRQWNRARMERDTSLPGLCQEYEALRKKLVTSMLWARNIEPGGKDLSAILYFLMVIADQTNKKEEQVRPKIDWKQPPAGAVFHAGDQVPIELNAVVGPKETIQRLFLAVGGTTLFDEAVESSSLDLDLTWEADTPGKKVMSATLIDSLSQAAVRRREIFVVED